MRLPLPSVLCALLSVAGLAACETGVGGTKGSYRPTEDACGAAGLQMLVGQSLSALTSLSLDQPVRVLKPGQVMTLEYQEDRLSATLDGSGRIARLACG